MATAAATGGGGTGGSTLVDRILNVWGQSSWFGGPNDPSSGPTTASGAPVSQPGIAVFNKSTLGGWWMIKAPNGAIGVVQQTDLGPAPSTGRRFDYTYSLLSLFGYNQKNFPTGGQTYGVYLGKGNPAAFKGPILGHAFKALGADASQQAVLMQSFDAGSLMQGKPAVVAPPNQKPGTTDTGAGQSPSASEAVPAGVQLPDVLGGIFNQIVGDAKYAVVLVVVLFAAGYLIVKGGAGGSREEVKVVSA